VFLSIPTRLKKSDETDAAAAPVETPTFQVPGNEAAALEAAQAAEHGGLRLEQAHGTTGGAAVPPPQVFQRGAFTFNRRFFETKFVNFFGSNRRDAEKDMVLLIKAGRGTYVAQRITRITGTAPVGPARGPASRVEATDQ
jgi:hypothetical protein